MRARVILGTNLAIGAAGLAWVLHRFGAPAAALLATGPDLVLLGSFVLILASEVVGHALRWQLLLAGIGARVPLGYLAPCRAAGQSISTLLPSAKLGGDPIRVLLLTRTRVGAPRAIASVVVDRTLEMGAAVPFVLLFATVLLRGGVPELEGAMVSVSLGTAALVLGIAVTMRRLRRRSGLMTAAARATGLDRLSVVRDRMGILEAAEEEMAVLVGQRRRLARAFALGVAINVVVLFEYQLLLAAFELPAGPLTAVAAIFAAGAAHSLPVPGAVGTLEGAQMWLFTILGHPPEVGLAVAFAVRLREVVWVAPGLVYVAAAGFSRGAPAPGERAGATSLPLAQGRAPVGTAEK